MPCAGGKVSPMERKPPLTRNENAVILLVCVVIGVLLASAFVRIGDALLTAVLVSS